jgi:transcription-repair coupling factor (superfamily II helicase)
VIHFTKKPSFEPIKLINLVQKDGRHRFAGPDKLRIERPVKSLADQVNAVKDFFRALS